MAGGQGQAIGSLGCGRAGASYTYAHLSIFLDGQQLAVPADVGWISPPTNEIGCVYPLHTDDTSGKIRIDATGATPFTLGQFFAIWGQPLSSSNIAGITGQPITVYVNDGGALTQYTGDLASLPLTSRREVTIQIGSALPRIPTYTWTDPPPLNPAPMTLLFGGSIGTQRTWPEGDTATGGQGQTVDGLACGPTMFTEYHVHAHVAIFRNGMQQILPMNVGIPTVDTPQGFCYYNLHTHDETGVIHTDDRAYQRLTLGQLFNIWGQPLSRTNIAGITDLPVVVYINDGGDVRQYTGDLGDIEMLSHRSITIQLGSRLQQIPTYSWDSYGGFVN